MPRPTKSIKAVLSHDYGIPGVGPRLYLPILVVSVGLFILIVPTWYQLTSYDGVLFAIFVAVTMIVSAISTRIQRFKRRRSNS
jgi:hypothetical protein